MKNNKLIFLITICVLAFPFCSSPDKNYEQELDRLLIGIDEDSKENLKKSKLTIGQKITLAKLLSENSNYTLFEGTKTAQADLNKDGVQDFAAQIYYSKVVLQHYDDHGPVHGLKGDYIMWFEGVDNDKYSSGEILSQDHFITGSRTQIIASRGRLLLTEEKNSSFIYLRFDWDSSQRQFIEVDVKNY